MTGILHENFINVHKGDLKSILPNVFKKLLSNPNSKSSLGIKYPSLRDHPLKIGTVWLAGKRLDDGAEGLWRIHDALYDLSTFVDNHPGGKDWLELTKGTDITEAFECHHLTDLPTKMLTDFYVRDAKAARNSPFTFKEDGFYRTLKKEISEALQTTPKQPIQRSKLLTDLLFISYIAFALLAVYLRSYTVGIASGVMLCLLAIASHNFFHQKDNFRMYYFDLSMMQSKEWRISHALSHHLYPNTILDIEVSSLEPFLQYLPNENMLLFRYISWLYSPIVYAFMFFGHFVRAFTQKFAFGESLELVQFLPFTVLAAMYITTGETLLNCTLMFAWIIIIGSILFGLIGVNAGHHHPKVFHDGDAIRPQEQMDWGVFQLDAVMDRHDITGSHFLVLTQFGDHALHHLFPTIDHGQLEYLYPVFRKTCEKFGVTLRTCSSSDSYKGQFQQLLRTEPNKIVPGTSEYYK